MQHTQWHQTEDWFPTTRRYCTRRWLLRSFREVIKTASDYDTTLATFAADYSLRATESRTPAYRDDQLNMTTAGTPQQLPALRRTGYSGVVGLMCAKYLSRT